MGGGRDGGVGGVGGRGGEGKSCCTHILVTLSITCAVRLIVISTDGIHVF